MSKIKDETKHIDDCECVYCGHIFDGRNVCNADMDADIIECPKCGKEMKVLLSIEYVCQSIEHSTEV